MSGNSDTTCQDYKFEPCTNRSFIYATDATNLTKRSFWTSPIETADFLLWKFRLLMMAFDKDSRKQNELHAKIQRL